MLRVRIDGRDHDLPEGHTILEACSSIGIDVPALCSDPRLSPQGACRLCVVRVEGRPRPVAACTTPLDDGMVVETHAPDIDASRRTLLRMLARDYPRGAVRAAPDKPFHRVLREYGLEHEPGGREDAELRDESHPCIHVDMSRCIECFRCVRICEDVQGQFVWQVVGRGSQTRIVPDSGTTLAESSCVACGACVDTCPTGALEDSAIARSGAPTRWTRTTCPYCGVGCEMLVGARDETIVAVTPALDAPVNRGHLCVKGRYAHGFSASPDRITHPMVKERGSWRAVSWDEAIPLVAQRLEQVVARHGPDAIGILGSARATNEDNYVVQKLARVAVGTNNVDCCARVCHAPSSTALRLMLGTGAATSSFDDIEAARAILVCGSNTTENHPVVGARIKQAKLRGARLVVIDPRRIELADYADVFLPARPGTTVAVLNAMAHTIVAEGLVDDDFARERVDGLDDFAAFVAQYAPERVAGLCGVDATRIREAARLYATCRPAICFHGLGVTEHRQGTEGVMALVDLALLTGNVGKPGAGINPLRGQNNVQGAAHMGCEPAHFPGFAPLADARSRFEELWATDLPPAPGLDVMQMLDSAAAGGLRALWVVGWDLLLTQPDAAVTREALAKLDTLVVQDLFLNETARELGTVFLPACSAFEKDGTFMNSERRVQRVRAVVDPPGAAKPDWEIVCLVARALGKRDAFDFGSPAEIWQEIRAAWAAGAGITYTRLERPGGLQWPCPTETHPGTTTLHADVFPGIGARASLRSVEHQPTPETASSEFPLILMTGRSLYQFNAGTMTRRSVTQRLRPTDTLEVAPDDAGDLGLRRGERVRVRSRYGAAVLPVEITARVARGQCFATFSDPGVFVNRVTGPYRDAYTHTPEYKVTAVRLERLDD